MKDLVLEALPHIPVGQQQIEYVERKGVGHPDSMCDAIMEAISVALAREYLATAGRVLHYNLDKALLVAGASTPRLGGGGIDAPMRLILGDRATREFAGKPIAVDEIAEQAVGTWLGAQMRFVELGKHVVLQDEIKSGSAELVDIFAREKVVANDTSVAVGYAPHSETEMLVLAAEQWLNCPDTKQEFPETGEDVKVMGVRRGHRLHLTVAVAFVDRFVPDEKTYFERIEQLRHALRHHLDAEITQLDGVDIHINTLDHPGRGVDGMYLTVVGTSAESGDGGQVGRGNPVNGIISLNRPSGSEAAAGKNPVSHVGKIYSLLTFHMAEVIHESVDGLDEVYVWLCSQIGRPVDAPWFASVNVVLAPDALLSDVADEIREIADEEIAAIPQFIDQLVAGAFPIC